MTAASGADRPTPTLANWDATCDWGDCNGQSYAVRWADDLGAWLAVCRKHRACDVVLFDALREPEFTDVELLHLQADLDELERTDPAVAAAAESYDRMVERVTGRTLSLTSGADQPTLREQLADVAHRAIQEASWERGVAMLDTDVAAFRTRLLADLLPVIEADRERAKAEGGAEALERAARDFDVHGLMFDASVPDLLRDRAAALRGSTGGGTA